MSVSDDYPQDIASFHAAELESISLLAIDISGMN